MRVFFIVFFGLFVVAAAVTGLLILLLAGAAGMQGIQLVADGKLAEGYAFFFLAALVATMATGLTALAFHTSKAPADSPMAD